MLGLYDRPAVTSTSAAPTPPSIQPVPATLPARTSTPRWSTPRPTAFAEHRQALPPHQRRLDLRRQSDITEESPVKRAAMVAWKEPIQRRVLDAPGMRGVVVVSSVAYGDGGGGGARGLLGSPATTPAI